MEIVRNNRDERDNRIRNINCINNDQRLMRNIIQKHRMIFVIATGLLLFLLFTGFTYSENNKRHNDSYIQNNLYTIRYSSIQIEAGDTLYDIAKEYAPDGVDDDEYVRNIMKINRLTDYDINAGKYLVIYYYIQS